MQSLLRRLLRSAILLLHRAVYEWLLRPFIFRSSAQNAHDYVIRLLGRLDRFTTIQWLFRATRKISMHNQPVIISGVELPTSLILAAGFVKGHGFSSEQEAQQAVENGLNIIPGWRSMPNLVGAVEFGSFTRFPRLGNDGTVMWRDVSTRSTQNRVGIKNPGACAAAQFLAKHRHQLPAIFGINIAVSPAVDDPQIEQTEVLDSIGFFLDKHVCPTWFTLNLSCPNTEDDPQANQTEAKTRQLCGAVVNILREKSTQIGREIPLWVKISPNLSENQYQVLMSTFHDVGVQAVIATNTLPASVSENPQLTAGLGGGSLHQSALSATTFLQREKLENAFKVDVIGCGGVMNGKTYQQFKNVGISVMQYWSALVYRGPLAAAQIIHEARRKSHH
jgi:dihydroorotate dehydrogenase